MRRRAEGRRGPAPAGRLACLVLGAVLALPAGAQRFDQRSVTLPTVPSVMEWRDLDRDGRKELLAIGADGFEVHRPLAGESTGLTPQSIREAGGGFLFDLADLDGDGRLELVMVRADGVHVWRYRDGRFVAPEDGPAIRLRRTLTPSRVLRVNLLRDLDGDGRTDLLYPSGERLLLLPGDGRGGFDAASTRSLPSGIRTVVSAPADALDGQLESRLEIPELVGRDVDGDGHLDFIASLGSRLEIYRGGADWTFAEVPTWVLDLSRFEQDAEPAERKLRIDLGGVNLSQDDLDGDGAADFLIASGRKVWIFFGGKGFRGFPRPDRILQVGEDIAAVLTGDVDGDGRADLVLVKFDMPGLARLVAALLVGIDLKLVALCYRNHGDRTLSRQPDRTNEITFSVPPLLQLLGNLGELERKARTARKRAGRLKVGDLTGNGIYDVGIREDGRLDLYACRGAGAVAGGVEDREVVNRILRDLLFDAERRTWDIDRLLDYMGDLRYSLNRDQIEGQRPLKSLKLRAGEVWRSDYEFVELNGDGKADIVVSYDRDGRRELDIYLSCAGD
ncbi:MAG: VCBS repeat-containing protein [Planctomycetes bacterium]|nr:VCBS repeat-containing protein [Planctomycetota bacterium]